MTAQMPPNVHGELEDVRSEIEQVNVGLRKEFEELPLRIRMSFQGQKKGESYDADGAVRDVAAEAQVLAVRDFDPGDSFQRQAIEWINRPMKKKATELEQAITIGAKKFVSQMLMERQGSPGTSVTYRVTSKSPYGL